MDKKERIFQHVLFDFLSLIPICVHEEDDELVWVAESKDYFYGYDTWCQIKKVLEACEIKHNDEFHRSACRGRYFLYVPKNDVNVGDGWISFQGDAVSLLYNHWDSGDWLEDPTTRPDGECVSLMKRLFAQYLETLNNLDGELDLNYCAGRFCVTSYSTWQSSLACIDEFLQQFKRYYIIPTHISKANFLRICKDDAFLRFGVTESGELIWNLLAFVKEHVDFSDCYYKNHIDDSLYGDIEGFSQTAAEYRLANELYNALHFEPFSFGKITKEKVFDRTESITKQSMNLSYAKADDDVLSLKKSIVKLIENGGVLQEIKEYQSRFSPEVIRFCQPGNRVLSFIENAWHSSDYTYNKMGDVHRSYLVISKSKTCITLIPSDKKYSNYVFIVKDGFDEIATALLVGYFRSSIENKRENLIIKSLFQKFGIIEFRKL